MTPVKKAVAAEAEKMAMAKAATASAKKAAAIAKGVAAGLKVAADATTAALQKSLEVMAESMDVSEAVSEAEAMEALAQVSSGPDLQDSASDMCVELSPSAVIPFDTDTFLRLINFVPI